MENILLTQFSATDIKNLVLEGIKEYFAEQRPQNSDADEIGGIALAERITGLKPQTIYAKVARREIPHFKQGGKLRFSAKDLTEWVKSGKRETSDELALQASAYQSKPKTRRNTSTR